MVHGPCPFRLRRNDHVEGHIPGLCQIRHRYPAQIVGGLILSPLIIGYRLRLVSDRAIRTAMSRVAFRGDEPDRLRRFGGRYTAEVLPGLIRPQAREQIAGHTGRGDRIVVVSASLDVYLVPWCRMTGVDVICTRLEVRDGLLTGSYVRGDCGGRKFGRSGICIRWLTM